MSDTTLILIFSVVLIVIFLLVNNSDKKLKKFVERLPIKCMDIEKTVSLGIECGYKINECDYVSLQSFYMKLLSSGNVGLIIDHEKATTLYKIKSSQDAYIEILRLYALQKSMDINNTLYPVSKLIRIRRIYRRRELD